MLWSVAFRLELVASRTPEAPDEWLELQLYFARSTLSPHWSHNISMQWMFSDRPLQQSVRRENQAKWGVGKWLWLTWMPAPPLLSVPAIVNIAGGAIVWDMVLDSWRKGIRVIESNRNRGFHVWSVSCSPVMSDHMFRADCNSLTHYLDQLHKTRSCNFDLYCTFLKSCIFLFSVHLLQDPENDVTFRASDSTLVTCHHHPRSNSVASPQASVGLPLVAPVEHIEGSIRSSLRPRIVWPYREKSHNWHQTCQFPINSSIRVPMGSLSVCCITCDPRENTKVSLWYFG